jgi:hypothetical protein
MIGSDEMSLFAGTYAYQSNKALRYQVIEARKKRDQYFVERYEILKPFLPEKASSKAVMICCSYVLTVSLVDIFISKLEL